MDDMERNDTPTGEARTPIAEQIIRIYASEPIVELTMRVFSKSAEQAIRTVMSESATTAPAPAEVAAAAADGLASEVGTASPDPAAMPQGETPVLEPAESAGPSVSGAPSMSEEMPTRGPVATEDGASTEMVSDAMTNGQEAIPSLEGAMSGWRELVTRYQQTREEQAATAPAEADAALQAADSVEEPRASAPGPNEPGSPEPAESLIARVAGGLLRRDEETRGTQ